MIDKLIQFFNEIPENQLELYNEAGLQHELAIFLRVRYPELEVKLEYPTIKAFDGENSFLKKKMDLYVASKHGLNYVIELKAPLGDGGVPNSMYKALEDVKFLEQVGSNRITGGYSIFASPAQAFWNSPRTNGDLYKMFNGDSVKFETIQKAQLPNFLQKYGEIKLKGTYTTPWLSTHSLDGTLWKYYILQVV